MANTNTNKRDWLEGLSPAALGVFDHRSLRFIEGAALVAGGDQDAVLPGEQVEVTNVKLLGSYNWTGQASPAILVPGSPPIWKNSRMPFSVISDEELSARAGNLQFYDYGASTEDEAAILAMLAAVTECTSPDDFQWRTSDIISDRNTLRNLLRWVGLWEKLGTFRIDMSLTGERSIVLPRWRQAVPEWSKRYSYGSSYEDNQTLHAPGCELSRKSCHDRIMSYDFGGLHVVSRFEADACLQAPPSPNRPNEQLAMTLLTHDSNRLPTVGRLVYRRVGQLVPQSQLIELCTRTRNSVLKPRDELYTQMALAGTSALKIALHDRGRFYDLRSEVIGQSPELVTAAQNVQTSLKRLRVLLGVIQELAVRYGKGKQLTLLNRDRKLEVFVREEGSKLPQEFEDIFAAA